MDSKRMGLPWRAESGFLYDKSDREDVAEFRGSERDDLAEEVGRRVNLHDELVSSLVKAHRALRLTDENGGGDIPLWWHRDEVFNDIDELLNRLGVEKDGRGLE